MELFDLGSSRIHYSFFHSFNKHADGAQGTVLYAFGIRNKSRLPSVDGGTEPGEQDVQETMENEMQTVE